MTRQTIRHTFPVTALSRVRVFALALVFGISLSALSLQRVGAQNADPAKEDQRSLRELILEAEYSKARALINSTKATEEDKTYLVLLDELDLEASCERAYQLIREFEFGEAVKELEAGLNRCAKANQSRQRANALLQLARAKELTSKPADKAFLKEFEESLAVGANEAITRLNTLSQIPKDIDALIVELDRLVSEGESAAASDRTSLMTAKFNESLAKVAKIESLVRSLEVLLSEREYDEISSARAETISSYVKRIAIAATRLNFFQKNDRAARKWLREGLERNILDRELIDWLSRLDERMLIG